MKAVLVVPSPWSPVDCIEHLDTLLSVPERETATGPLVPAGSIEQFAVQLRVLLKKLSIGSLRSIEFGPKGCRIYFQIRNVGAMLAIPLLLNNLPVGTAIYRIDWLGRKRNRVLITP
jgi:hypothetical protein